MAETYDSPGKSKVINYIIQKYIQEIHSIEDLNIEMSFSQDIT